MKKSKRFHFPNDLNLNSAERKPQQVSKSFCKNTQRNVVQSPTASFTEANLLFKEFRNFFLFVMLFSESRTANSFSKISDARSKYSATAAKTSHWLTSLWYLVSNVKWNSSPPLSRELTLIPRTSTMKILIMNCPCSYTAVRKTCLSNFCACTFVMIS